MKKLVNPVWAFLLSLGLLACSTPMHRAMQEVEMGMSKSEVIEKLGSPNRTDRDDGTDKWFYSYDTDGHRRTSEIHFKDSRVVHMGRSPQGSADDDVQDADTYQEYKDNIKKNRKEKSKNFEDL